MLLAGRKNIFIMVSNVILSMLSVLCLVIPQRADSEIFVLYVISFLKLLEQIILRSTNANFISLGTLG